MLVQLDPAGFIAAINPETLQCKLCKQANKVTFAIRCVQVTLPTTHVLAIAESKYLVPELHKRLYTA
jgi:hypothetical protein